MATAGTLDMGQHKVKPSLLRSSESPIPGMFAASAAFLKVVMTHPLFPRSAIRSLLAIGLCAAASGAAMAAPACTVEIEGNDAMQFNTKSIEVSKACKDFTVKLKHTGKLPKAAMGHNWVLTKTADVQAVAADGIPAGVANQYVKAGDARVIAYTKVLGPGESDSVTFSVKKLTATDSYTFFCSFPGHSGIMKGTLKLVN